MNCRSNLFLLGYDVMPSLLPLLLLLLLIFCVGYAVRLNYPLLLQCGSESLQGEAARADAAEARCQELEAKGAAVTDRLQEAVTALQVRCRPSWLSSGRIVAAE